MYRDSSGGRGPSCARAGEEKGLEAGDFGTRRRIDVGAFDVVRRCSSM